MRSLFYLNLYDRHRAGGAAARLGAKIFACVDGVSFRRSSRRAATKHALVCLALLALTPLGRDFPDVVLFAKKAIAFRFRNDDDPDAWNAFD